MHLMNTARMLEAPLFVENFLHLRARAHQAHERCSAHLENV
jgi:hypothetical protein